MGSILSIQLKIQLDDDKPYDGSVTSAYPEYIMHKFDLATATTDEAVSFGGVTTADFIWITSNQDISYKLSGGSDIRALEANKFSLLYGIAATSLTLSNASGETARVKITIAG